MKIKNIALALTLLAGTGFIATSCEDMLTVDTGDKIYVNANDTLYSYLGIFKHIQDIAERQVILNELRGDLCSTTDYVTDTLHAISNFDDPADGSCSMLNISDYYAIINNCNLYIANADTSVVKSNKKYMIPEYAQVQAIRAWTYLKLVELYGEVPFIAEPISNLDVIHNFNYNANLVNKDNLVDRILELGLDKYVDTEYPIYDKYNNGAIDISARLFIIPVRLVLADLYLLRGASQSDYRQAATYYYEYLRATSSTVTTQYVTARKSRVVSSYNTDPYDYSSYNWGSYGSTYTYSTTSEVISSIPSSANKQFGTMLTRVADIFGYTPTSSQSNETSTNDDGEEETSTSGSIRVTPNYKAQLVPSAEYIATNKAQTYVHWDTSIEQRDDYECGDARFNTSTSSHITEGTAYRLADKAARGNTFYYTIPTYRKTLVWLRLAEAINRAGFPQHAFAILKDGLCPTFYPDTTATRTIYPIRFDQNGDTLFNDNGVALRDTILQHYTRYASNGALHYVDSTEIANFFLNFNMDMWAANFGIHARGCGYGTWNTNTSSTTINGITTNLTGYNDSTVFDFKPRLQVEGVDVETADKADIINAVENVICDELALELAFEGFRFSDLVRMANHKNASGYNGTDWLANKIASRTAQAASEDGLTPAVPRDEALYNKLYANPSLWYFSKPAWSAK